MGRHGHRSAASAPRDFAENCTPGYYNNEGSPSATSRQGGFFFGAPTEYVEILEALARRRLASPGWRSGRRS